MAALLIPLVGLSVVGAMIGWFSRGRIVRALLFSSLASLVALGGVLLYGGEPKSVEAQYLATVWVYWVVPYVVFFLGPCVTAAALMAMIGRKRIAQ